MTPKERLDKLAVYLLAPKEEANVQLDYNEIALILSDVKQTLNEHEALKKDVARYVELDFFHIAPYRFRKKYANENKLIGETVKESISRLDNEWLSFIQKLKKVGKEE